MTTQKRRKSRKERLLRIPEAAYRLNYKPSTMRALIAQQRITVVRLSARAIRISEAEIERLIAQGTVPARGAA